MAASMRALLAALLVSGLLLAGCSGTPSEEPSDDASSSAPGGPSSAGSSQPATGGNGPTGPPPQLTVGDFWEHESEGGGASVTTRMEVMAIEDYDGDSAYRLEGTIETSVSGSSFDADSTSWIRVSDHANIETESSTSLSFGGQSYDTTTTTVYDPPCATLRWPLTVGATWTVTCTSTTTSSSGGGSRTTTNSTTYTVEAQESVTVQAGTFDAFRIRVEADDQTHKQWISAEACGMVKSEANADGQTVTTELVDHEC